MDEAHGTAGDLGRPWAAIHDNARIPADFRQDSETYGPWLAELGLSEAIEKGILAGFEIDVLEIRDPSPVVGLSEEALRAGAWPCCRLRSWSTRQRTTCARS
ncbi:hypothetical protein GCM10010121_099430 [Streptomyces brasiliensis]|uniref:Uncharacterized protein n=1 Tax=Streptomyces brasiliensis TaxID=1954 RepID=A0A917UPS5_9ACTN|nr:hypothetical protein GCM10010121_099430 [Streptomyces brasiliensis]